MKRIIFALLITMTVAFTASAVEKTMQPQGKTLVVCYSRSGNTSRVAKDLAANLNADLESLQDKKNRHGFMGVLGAAKDGIQKKTTQLEPLKFNPEKYSVIVIGTPTWFGNMTPAIRTYLQQNKAQLNNIAVYSTSGSTPPDKIVAEIEKITGKKVVNVTGFDSKVLKDPAQYQTKLQKFIEGIKK